MTCNGLPVRLANHMMQLGRRLTYRLHRGDKQAVVGGEAAELREQRRDEEPACAYAAHEAHGAT